MRGSMPEEIWEDVKGFEGFYQVSNYGRVYSFHRKGQLISPETDKDGYLKVTLHKHGVKTKKFCHRLVAEVFVDNLDCENFDMVNHIDSNKQNNCAGNLEWCNNSLNIIHSYKSKNSHKTLSDLDPLLFGEMVNLYKCGMSCPEIVKYYDLTCKSSEINRIMKGSTFTYYTGLTEDITRKGKAPSKYSDHQIKSALKEYFIDGVKEVDICNKYGIGRGSFYSIKTGKIRKKILAEVMEEYECIKTRT